jgi:transcriptional regulator with XRE-family HTH domain
MPTVPHLRAIREWRVLTQAELAARCGTKQPSIARIEAGATVWPSTVRKLARALRVTPADLVGGLGAATGPTPPPPPGSSGRLSPVTQAMAQAERARRRGDAEDAERWETIAAAIVAAQAS